MNVKQGFQIEIEMHTDDARQVLSSPEELRFALGVALDGRGVEEEIDYTLTVSRTYTNGETAREMTEHVSACGDEVIAQLDYAINGTPDERMTAVRELIKHVPAISAYHASQMSGIAKRAAEKIVELMNDYARGYDGHPLEEVAAIIEQEGKR
jgi:hypothetical protein